MDRNFPTITLGLLYHNAPEMIDWIYRALGFEKKLVLPQNDGSILHVHLTFGNGGIMLSSAENYENPELCRSPRQIGSNTVEIIVYVEDIEAHYEKAQHNGAKIVFPLESKPYGGKGYTVRDPEGYIWALGSYGPWLMDLQSKNSLSK